MECLPGETLADKIARREALRLGDQLRFAQELCEGLAHAHKAGVIHRDIKPANIAVDRDENSVKILDFGIARAVDADTTGPGVMVGTLTYMSPEQVSGRPVDDRSDIFSAGLVLYELLSYRRRFPAGPKTECPIASSTTSPNRSRSSFLDADHRHRRSRTEEESR
jgi:eukaryotic-like serine/threonine-protein kinase